MQRSRVGKPISLGLSCTCSVNPLREGRRILPVVKNIFFVLVRLDWKIGSDGRGIHGGVGAAWVDNSISSSLSLSPDSR